MTDRRSARRLPVAFVAAITAVLASSGTGVASADLQAPATPLLEGPVTTDWPATPELSAPIHLLVDARTGQVLSAAGADERRPVASTVKMLTALAAVSRADLDEVVRVGDEVAGLEGASVSLTPGERWTVRQLLEGLLVRSGNDAAEALAVAVGGDREAFVDLLQQDARDLGLRVGGPRGLTVTAPSGLDGDERLSARDLATIARALLAEPELRRIVALPGVDLPDIGTDENRNVLVEGYPGATGVKTGFTEAAGYCLVASARRDDRELVAVVLGAGPDPERFVDAARLLDHGFAAFEDRELEGARTFLLAGGTRTVTVEPSTVVAPTGTDVELAFPLPVRVPEPGRGQVPVRFDGRRVAGAPATVSGPTRDPVEGGAALGRAVVDGVYAALRSELAAQPPGERDPAAGPGGAGDSR